MYGIGELVMYGRTGVCQVAGVREQEGNEYYVLKPLYQNCDILAPVTGGKIYIRPLITREEAHRLIDALPELDAPIFESHVTRELNDHYLLAINSHDCEDLFRMTKSIYAKKQRATATKKKFGAVDEKFLKWGQELLFGELSAVLELSPEQVLPYIQDRLKARA